MNYPGNVLHKTMSGETMAFRVIEKINSKMKFLYRKNWFLDVLLRRLLRNASIQSHFDYDYAVWYPNLPKKLTDKLHVTQNKCIRFCLKLQCREHILNEHFHKCPAFINEVFQSPENMRINTRNSFLKLTILFKKPVLDKRISLILDLPFRTEFQKFFRKPEIWIFSNIRRNTTIWMISLIQVYEMLVDLIML